MTVEQMRMELTMPDISVGQADDDSPAVNVFRPDDNSAEQKDLIRQHQLWLNAIRKEYPLPSTPYRIGVYIRYFNQTKYRNYLDYHKKQFADTIALCPLWTLVDFYVDTGQSAPNMENAPEWCRLLNDCLSGKVNLIITQKVSNVSRKAWDLSMVIRILAACNTGIYFISEDIFTMASYYRRDMRDVEFLPKRVENLPCEKQSSENVEPLPLVGGSHVE